MIRLLAQAKLEGGLEHIQSLEQVKNILKGEYNPKDYDKAMGKTFNEKYYSKKDGDSAKVMLMDQNAESESEADDAVMVKEPKKFKQKIDEKLLQATSLDDLAKDEGYEDIWWACDGCMQPIKAGKFRFDCKLCENFTFCKECFMKNESHVHPFKKVKVQGTYEPPKNADELT